MPAVNTNPPPAWPEKGSPEYEERLAKMRAGWQKKRQAAAQQQRESKRAAFTVDPDLIDTGEPEAVRMAPEEREEPKSRGGAKGSKGKPGEFSEPTLREYLSLAVNGLATLEGHEHWARSDQELAYVTVPGTRCLNRLDRKTRERLEAMSDPAALVFGVVFIFGPSVMKELEHVGKKQTVISGGKQQQPVAPASPQRRSESEAESGPGGDFLHAYTAAVPTNGAAPTPQVDGIHATGI